MKKRKDTGIFRFLALFSKIWKIEGRYKGDKIGDKVKLCSIPMSTLKKEEKKLFHKYCVFLPTR